MSGRQYFAPLPALTGSISMQTRSGQTNPAWHFGPRYESYFPTEFLDAPDTIPTGSVRAMDCGAELTLGIDYAWREKPQAVL